MKKSIVLGILSLLVWGAPAQVGWSYQETDNPFPPVLPNPPEIRGQEKQEEEKDGPIVIDLNEPAEKPAEGPPKNPLDELQPSTPDQPKMQTLPEPEPDQKVLVREKFAGWNEAGTGAGGATLGDQLRANWVLLGNNGLLQGRQFHFFQRPAGYVLAGRLRRRRFLCFWLQRHRLRRIDPVSNA